MLKSSSNLPEFTHKVKPFAHQQEVLDLSLNLEYFGLFMEMGTGKSKVMIDNMTKLFLDRKIDGVLIVAPKGGYLNWIDEEIPIHMSETIPRRIMWYDVDAGKLERRISEALIVPQDDCLDIMVMNVESLTTDKAYDFAVRFLDSHYNLMIIDESTSIKNHKSKRAKAMYKLGSMVDYRRILTGTPITDSPLDLYGQCEFLKPGLLGHDNWVSFQNYYAKVVMVNFGGRRYDKIEGYKNLAELAERIKAFTYRKLKSECLDLPEKIWKNHYVESSPEQTHAYDKMRDEALLSFSETEFVSSTSVITTMVKLHQINCGHVRDDFGNVHNIPNNRIKDLISILKLNKGKKIIIWVNFVQDIHGIKQAIWEEFKQVAQTYYGESSVEERRQSLENFKHGNADYFLATLSTAAMALTIVESHFAIYYSYDYNLMKWLQSQDRNHRPGQKHSVTYIVMQIPNTVDTRIIKSLKAKEDLANQVLNRETAIELLS